MRRVVRKICGRKNTFYIFNAKSYIQYFVFTDRW